MFPLKIAEKVSQELRNFVFTREFILAWDLINADSMNVTKHFIGGKPGRGMKHGIPKRWEHFYRHWWERIHEDIFKRISANGSIKAHTSKFLQDIYTWIDPNWWHNSTSFFHEMINRKYLKHLVRRRMYVMFVQKHSLSHSNWGYINVCILGNVLTRAGNFIPQFFFKTYIIEMPFTIRKNRNSKCKKFLNHIHIYIPVKILRENLLSGRSLEKAPAESYQ